MCTLLSSQGPDAPPTQHPTVEPHQRAGSSLPGKNRGGQDPQVNPVTVSSVPFSASAATSDYSYARLDHTTNTTPHPGVFVPRLPRGLAEEGYRAADRRVPDGGGTRADATRNDGRHVRTRTVPPVRPIVDSDVPSRPPRPTGRTRRRSPCRGCRAGSSGRPRRSAGGRTRPARGAPTRSRPTGRRLSGIGLTCTQPLPRALSFSARRSARQAWSFMSLMRRTRSRPVDRSSRSTRTRRRSPRRPSTASSPGWSSSRSSSSGACSDRAKVSGMSSSASFLIAGTRPTVETVDAARAHPRRRVRRGRSSCAPPR